METGATVKKAKDNTIEIRLTIRGNPAGVVNALANGLPLEALADLRDGMTAELERRRLRPSRSNRPVRILGRFRK